MTWQVALPGAGNVPVGIAPVAAENGVATARVRLNGVATAALNDSEKRSEPS